MFVQSAMHQFVSLYTMYTVYTVYCIYCIMYNNIHIFPSYIQIELYVLPMLQ